MKREKVVCPTCGHASAVYRIRFTRGFADNLIRVFNANRVVRSVEIAGSRVAYTVFPKLSYWGLIEKWQASDKALAKGGYWKITEKGKRFVAGLIRVPEYVLRRNNRTVGFEGDEIRLGDVDPEYQVREDFVEQLLAQIRSEKFHGNQGLLL